MSKFRQVLEPEEPTVLWEYRAGNISVVALGYALGQYRLQVWLYGGAYPEIVGPDC